MVKKLTSRKFWACVAGVVAGLAAAFGLDEGTVSQVAGIVTALVSVVTYMITEGRIDAAAVSYAAEQVDQMLGQVAQEQEAFAAGPTIQLDPDPLAKSAERVSALVEQALADENRPKYAEDGTPIIYIDPDEVTLP